jgi:SSS family solute:Na+ symporter
MDRLPLIDLIIVVGYNLAVVALGCTFWRRSGTSERFMSAGRSIPGWALGLSVFGSYVSSISFLANPGKAFADNWNSFVFAVSMPLAAGIAVRWFVPFYRRSGAVSGYEHLEHRFGPWARTYAVICFLLLQLVRLGAILYLLAQALKPLLGWEESTMIVMTGLVVTLYPLLGGAEAWIWTGVFQAILLLGGTAICVAALLAGMPEGPGQVFRIAIEEGKFNLGSFGASVSESTFWVVLVYGLVTHLQNFGIDQSYVQRYITSESGKGAARSIWMGTWMFMPVSAAFFFIGTALFAFYRSQAELLPAAVAAEPDRVFPHFIRTQLPPGLTGLVIAAVCAAAMDSNLTCSATLFLCDIYKRYLRRGAGEREALWVLRLTTLGFGGASMAVAFRLFRVPTTLDAWWKLAGITSGGTLGLFLLGILCRRAGSGAALAGVASGVAVIIWMTVSKSWGGPLAAFRSPFHDLLILVIGTGTILGVGVLSALLFARRRSPSDPSMIVED